MSNWNNAGGASEWNQGSGGAEWNSGATAGGEWNDGGNAGASGFEGTNGDAGFTSQDARGDVNDSACRNCGQDGHTARDCAEPKKMGACFNCGEEGHSKSDCTKPRKFTGACRECNEEGHQARDCPKKPQICRQCLQEGHDAIECKNAKVLDTSKIPDKTEAEAWAMLKQASDEKDLDDFRDAVKVLAKAAPTTTYVGLEKDFRKRGFKVYLIGLEKTIEETWTIVNLQGEVGKKYAIGYYLSEKPQRPKLLSMWPESPAANLERLADAGTAVDRGIPKCNNCGQMGHTKRQCSDDIIPIEQVKISCMLCGEDGHRVRDCTQERQKPREPRACKICEETDHIAKECPNKPKRACHKCGDEDHMAKDCDVIKCRNCDEIGHESRDCTAPKDWSRVKCRNCGEMGHTIKRCKQPIKEDENAPSADAGAGETFGDAAGGFDAGAAGGFDSGAGGGGDWNTPAATGGSTHNEWEVSQPALVAVGGAGGGW